MQKEKLSETSDCLKKPVKNHIISKVFGQNTDINLRTVCFLAGEHNFLLVTSPIVCDTEKRKS